jgi:hypothetical protein
MKRLMLIVLALFAIVAVGCSAVIDSEGAKIGDPKRFAEATHVARMSEESVQATSTAVSLQTTRTAAEISAQATRTIADITARATAEAIANEKRQSEAAQVGAQATAALAKAKTEVEAQPSEAAGKSIGYLLGWSGLGVGALILVIGLAFGVVAWVNKRATIIYPNKQGQFPLLPEHGPGYTVYHDPNRALGPGTVINRPGIADRLTHVILREAGKNRNHLAQRIPKQRASRPCCKSARVHKRCRMKSPSNRAGPKCYSGFCPLARNQYKGNAPAKAVCRKSLLSMTRKR